MKIEAKQTIQLLTASQPPAHALAGLTVRHQLGDFVEDLHTRTALE
jgi:hypothetical protein